MRTLKLYLVGLALLLSGFGLIVVGSFGEGSVSTGGFILIGPLPIIFGSGKYGGLLAALSVVAGLVTLVMVYLLLRRVWVGRPPETTLDR